MDSSFDPVGLVLWFVAFLFSTTCHEAAHAWSALRGGDETAFRAGQVTLNPLPHIRREPFGMVVVPLLVYALSGYMIGWASAPYDPHWAARHPRRAGLMAAAGPLANFVLAGLAIVAIRLVVAAGWGLPPEQATFDLIVRPTSGDPLALAGMQFLSILACLNVLLGVFNLIPLPPLDGASVLESFGGTTAARAMETVRSAPMAGLIGLLVAWQVFGFVAGPLFRLVLDLVHPGLYG
ncbi:MAG: site-2 protease family protein [Acidobacteriota bacterium]|nr:MAG: site-2 protease family protein [Acidobacteriota bacterium]